VKFSQKKSFSPQPPVFSNPTKKKYKQLLKKESEMSIVSRGG